MTQNTNTNAEPYAVKKTARLSVANESFETFSGTVTWALRDPAGSAIKSGEYRINAPALSSVWLDTLDFGDCALYENYVSFALNDDNGESVSEGGVLFCMPKHFRFINPELTAEVHDDGITVTAAAYAKSVEIDCDDADILLSDNYFDMNGGKKTVRVLRGKPGNIRLRSVYDIR